MIKDGKEPSIKLVLIAMRVHLIPSRTQKLSSFAPTILGGRLPGKIGNANTENHIHKDVVFSCFIEKIDVILSMMMRERIPAFF